MDEDENELLLGVELDEGVDKLTLEGEIDEDGIEVVFEREVDENRSVLLLEIGTEVVDEVAGELLIEPRILLEEFKLGVTAGFEELELLVEVVLETMVDVGNGEALVELLDVEFKNDGELEDEVELLDLILEEIELFEEDFDELFGLKELEVIINLEEDVVLASVALVLPPVQSII